MTRTLPLTRLRNFGVIAHVDAGKTTLTERVLFACGAIHKTGEVHHGTTTTDHHPLERAKGITIGAAAVRCGWRDHEFQLIDTPGHVDFAIEVERCLRVLDGCVVVLDAVAGVEPQTESVWHKATRHGLPRLVFVNKLDRQGADFGRCVDEVKTRLGAVPVVLFLPWREDEQVRGIIDVVHNVALRLVDGALVTEPVPMAEADARDAAFAAVVAAVADVDEAVFADVVFGRVPDTAALMRGLRTGTLQNAFVPVLCGAALKDLGIEPLLDAIVAFLPSPKDRGAVAGVGPDDDVAVLALAFKVVHDKYGPTTLVRVYAGTLERGSVVVSSKTQKKLRVGRLCRVFAGWFQDVDGAVAGDIVGLVGETLATGDTLCGAEHVVALESVTVPAPVMSMAIEPHSHDDRSRLSTALGKMVAEDPSLVVRADDETGQTTLSGQGELHLEVALSKLQSDHGVVVDASAPRVAFKETLGESVEHGLTWSKQTGGPGQWARLRLRVSPAARGSGLVFADVTKGGVVPKAFAAAIRDGVVEAMERGPGWGHPMVDVEVVLLDGAIHEQDSSEKAFFLAGRACFTEAAKLCAPRLLEPLMQVDVTTPEDRLGDVVADLTRRRGLVRSVDSVGVSDVRVVRIVRADVPLAGMFGYAGALRSLSQGRASFTAEPRGLAFAPESSSSRGSA